MSDQKQYTCPICGYHGLNEPPRFASGGASYQICPSCWFEFGVTDDDKGFTYDEWRRDWIAEGMPWRSRVDREPENWDPAAQLRGLGGASAGG